jgi:MFS family permease
VWHREPVCVSRLTLWGLLTVPAFRLSCACYVSVALPTSTLGLLWPSIRVSLDQPVAALGFLLALSIAAMVVASTVAGRLLPSMSAGPVLALGTGLTAAALAAESLAPSLWLFTLGTVVFGFGFGAIDAAVNVHAARHFSARQINWMHASYGAGATIGPLLATLMLSNAVSWRGVYLIFAGVQAALAVLFAVTGRAWGVDRPPPATAGPAPRSGGRRRPGAASAAGGAALSAGLGVVIGMFSAGALGAWLLLPSVAMYAVYRALTRESGGAGADG